jgi:ribosomal protein S18 acetylase RimI-like enzyme
MIPCGTIAWPAPTRLHMNFRDAVSTDYLPIAELHATSWRAAYKGALSDEYLTNHVMNERRALWNERLHHPADNQIVVVSQASDTLLGFACAFAGEDPQWGSLLDNIHVAQAARRKGLGSMLLAEIAKRCAASNPDAGLHLWVLQSNVSAQRFYESLGAACVGEGVWAAPDGNEIAEFRYAWPAGRLPQRPL